MNYVYEQLINNFEFLCDIIKQDKNNIFSEDLRKIQKIIFEKIPEKLKKNAPVDYYELYMDFIYEYKKFKKYILYSELFGKNIVALGGAFSSGKSSFLNALNNEKALPESIDYSTSVPTYIVNGEKYTVHVVNIFDTKIKIQVKEIRKIAHGFGKIENDNDNIITKGTTLGHILESVVLSTPKQKYFNIAFLDTPGYSNSQENIVKTDAQISRGQLNSSNFILWFIDVDLGTVTKGDIDFIKTLDENIPKLFILSKADKKPIEELEEIVLKIKSNLNANNISFLDVLKFSREEDCQYDIQKIKNHLKEWDKVVYKDNFIQKFKIIFIKCDEYYDKNLENESKRLNRLRQAILLLEKENVVEGLNLLVEDIKNNISELKNMKRILKELKDEFFAELNRINEKFGIIMEDITEYEIFKEDKQSQYADLKKNIKLLTQKQDSSFSKIIKDRL